MPRPVSRRQLLRGLAAAAVVIGVLGGAVAFILLHAPGNVSHPNLQFTRPSTAPVVAPPAKRERAVSNFLWPWYGYDAGRTRFFQGPAKLRPPFRVGWQFGGGALLEFPPVIYQDRLYLLDDGGMAKAVSTIDGHEIWHRRVGTLAAASPAIAAQAGLVLMPVLSIARRSPGNGRFVAVSIRTGRIVWSRPVSSGSESSPIVDARRVYFGDQSGTLHALSLAHGAGEWSYRASGAIKAGPALVGGVLYFGDYAGRAYAVRARDGHQVWAVGTDGAHFGFGSGQFYASPAVSFGRVYMGNTDGRVYSFGARTGALAWATSTGAYVYASPAVADPRGLGPTVYVGSYDGNLYAFNAQSGAVRWVHRAGGRISGSATVVGDVLYYSDLGSKTTSGLDVVTGKQVFEFRDGAFTPVIADYRAIYMAGYSRIYELLPARGSRPAAPRRARRSPNRRRAVGHRAAGPNPAVRQGRSTGHRPQRTTRVAARK